MTVIVERPSPERIRRMKALGEVYEAWIADQPVDVADFDPAGQGEDYGLFANDLHASGPAQDELVESATLILRTSVSVR